MTIHFVYVHEAHINTTSAIGREIPERLARDYDVKVYHPNDPGIIEPRPGDILIGHPNRYAPCIFSRSLTCEGWARRILFAPFSHGILEDAAAIDTMVDAADVYLAISGQYWFDSIEASPVSHWRFKMRRCDLGVNRSHFPKIKGRFSPPGRRRFYFVGNGDPMRGGDYLAQLADRNPDVEITWFRTSDARHCLDGTVEPQTFRLSSSMLRSKLRLKVVSRHKPAGLQLLSGYDFIIQCGRSDALPCEILEAASWGHVPVCTPQCGFPADDWMTHIPLDDVAAASTVLRRLSMCPEEELLARQAAGFRHLEETYNWDAVTEQVRAAIEEPVPARPSGREWTARARANSRRLRKMLLRERTWRRLDRLALYATTLSHRALSRAGGAARLFL